MKVFAETERLILRELEYTDKNDLFEMDSDPEVHLFIENNPDKQDLREFNKGFSKDRLESLVYKTKKAFKITTLDIHTENTDANEELVDDAVLHGGSFPGGKKPKPKAAELSGVNTKDASLS
jgi:RimJ/RimL family protein N-acetyltransferase